MTVSDPLDAAFAALAHPVRRAILAELVKGQATVNELAAPFDMSLPAVSRHIKVLERAGLVSQAHDGQFRPCTLNAAPLEAVANWTEQYLNIWEARFDVMESSLQQMRGTRDGE